MQDEGWSFSGFMLRRWNGEFLMNCVLKIEDGGFDDRKWRLGDCILKDERLRGLFLKEITIGIAKLEITSGKIAKSSRNKKNSKLKVCPFI